MTRAHPWQHRVADLRRGRMHYVSAGSGPSVVVLLHGWPGFWFDYRDVIAGAARIGQVIAPDFLGFGESSALPGDDPAAADELEFARDIHELLSHLRAGKVVLVGHDIGSAVGPALARLAPDLVAGVVLLNPTHPHIGQRRFTREAQREAWYQHFHVLPLAAELIDGDAARVETYLAHFYQHWAGEQRISPDDFDAVVRIYARPGAFASSLAWYRARARRRAETSVPAPVTVRTIALWGDRDPMRPLTHRSGFERAFPDSESRVLPGVGHFVPAEAPDAVIGAVVELLEDPPSRGGDAGRQAPRRRGRRPRSAR